MKIILSLTSETIEGHFHNIFGKTDLAITNAQSLRGIREILQENDAPLVCVDNKRCPEPFEVLETVRNSSPTTQIIYVTDEFDHQTALDWMNKGGLAFLSIPVDPDDIRLNVVPIVNIYKNQNFQVETEQKLGQRLSNKRKQLDDEAKHDGLTDLLNKKYFKKNAQTEIVSSKRKGQELTISIIDVDHFKKFNDIHGHQRGDEVIQGISDILSQDTRNSDIVGRIGGERFGLILPGTDQFGGFVTVERIRSSIESQRFKGEHRLPSGRITISAGLSSFPEHAENFDRLMNLASRGMRYSKNRGRNQTTMTKNKKFSYKSDGEDHDQVSLVGDFNDWNPDSDPLKKTTKNTWSKTIPVPEGPLEFGFSIDGDEITKN